MSDRPLRGSACQSMGAASPIRPKMHVEFEMSESERLVAVMEREGKREGRRTRESAAGTSETLEPQITAAGASVVSPEDEECHEEAVPKTREAPPDASPAERERHRVTGHAQYRAWCRECVATRGRADGHRSSGSKNPPELPILSWDYAYPVHPKR